MLECLLIALGTSFVMCIREGCYGQSGDVYAVQHETFACGLVLGHSHRYFTRWTVLGVWTILSYERVAGQ